mgnify:CR=1 FL=1
MQQQGKVIAVDQHKIWVDVTRQNACNSCSAKNGCGTSLMERALPNSGSVFELNAGNNNFELGSWVDISMDEDKIVSASLLIYGLPLLCLLMGAMAANAVIGADLGAIVGAIIGFGFGFLITRTIDARMAKNLAPTITASNITE